jgi:hypothetical protein
VALPTRDFRAGEETNEGGSDRCAVVDDDDDDDSNKAIKIEAADVMMDGMEHDDVCTCLLYVGRYGTCYSK